MSTKKDKSILQDEFIKLKYDCNRIYRWKSNQAKSYTELIAKIILENFQKLEWSDKGLRKENFNTNHVGTYDGQKDVNIYTEKRFCRALYNAEPLSSIGNVIDYEVPLTAPGQGIDKVAHGDIDFISITDSKFYLFEAKKVESKESLLKAILEIYTYTNLLVIHRRIDTLLEEFKVSKKYQLVPAILTFSNSVSGEQINQLERYPQLYRLITQINSDFNKKDISPFEFFVIDNYINENLDDTIYINQDDNKIKFNVLPNIQKVEIE